MPRENNPLLKVTLNVYREDWEKLATLHKGLGPSRVTRELIHAHVRRVEEAMAQRQPRLPDDTFVALPSDD